MVELILVKVREISILRMFNAMEMRVILKSVHPVMLEIMTVAIQRMLESAVKVCVTYIFDLGVILGPLRFHLQLYKSVTNI